MSKFKNMSLILLIIIQGLVMFTYCITSLILLKCSENIRLKLRIIKPRSIFILSKISKNVIDKHSSSTKVVDKN